MITLNRGNVHRLLGTLLPFALTAGVALAEAPVVSGYVETNTIYYLNKPMSAMNALRTYYDNPDRDFNNNAHLAFTGKLGEQAAYTVEIDAGSEARLTSGDTSTGVPFDIQEAYLTYAGASKLGMKVGKFATFQGIEVLEGPMNPTISRGYLYGLAECFTHVGGVATYAAGPLDFAAGLVNGWDLNNDNNDSKTAVWKVGFAGGDPLALTLSGYHGPEQAELAYTGATSTNTSGNDRSNIDLTGVTKVIPKVDLWFQLHYGQEERVTGFDAMGTSSVISLGKWSGFGIQPVVKLSDKVTIGARAEYFADPDGARTGVDDVSAVNYTITPGYMFTENVGAKAEFRVDQSNKKIWVDDEGTAEDSTSSVGLQFYAIF